MTQFEYISVAVALLFAIAVGRLLTSLPSVFDRERRYGVHAAWVVYLLLYCALQWWQFWLLRDHVFDTVDFILALALPGFVIVRVELLLGRESDLVADYRERFYRVRIPFFSVGLASMTMLMVAPWVYGQIPWGEVQLSHVVGLVPMSVWIVGLLSDRHLVHVSLISLQLLFNVWLLVADVLRQLS